MRNLDELSESWRRTMDSMVHGGNNFQRPSAATATAYYDSLARLFRGDDPRSVSSDDWITEAQTQRTTEVVWLVGDTLARPTGLASCIRTVLVVPNNTRLDSTAEVTQATLQRYPALAPSLEGHRKDTAEWSIGSAAACGAAGGFEAVTFAVCRQPGKPELVGLEDSLRAAMRGGEYRPLRAVIPVWGGKEQLDTWAGALSRIVVDASKTQAGIRLPVMLLLRPADEQLGHALEHALIKRGVLAGRENELPRGVSATGDTGPEYAFDCVRRDGVVTPSRYADWCARDVHLQATTWDRHIRIWREVNHAK